MRPAWQEFSALFGSVGPGDHPAIPALGFGLCAALAYPLATQAGYAGAVGGAFVFCVATLFLAYSLAAGALAFTVEANRSCLPGSQRLMRRAIFIAFLLLVALVVIPAAALAANPMWGAWVPTALVLGIGLACVLIPVLPVGAVGLLLLGVLTAYWAVRGQADHERSVELLFALLSAALSLAAVAKWRRVIHEDSRPPSLARWLRPFWNLLGRRPIGTRETGEIAEQVGFQDRPSPVTVIRTCLGANFAALSARTRIILAAIVTLFIAAVVITPPSGRHQWDWPIMLVAFLAASLLSSGFLDRISKLTREGLAELALLPGLGDSATQRRALCWAVLVPPLPWLAGILLWGSACLLFKGGPLSRVGVLSAYILIIWLTYTALALLRIVTFPLRQRNRIPVIFELLRLYFLVYLWAVYTDVYAAYPFTHVGQWSWVFWIVPVAVSVGFASAIGYSVRRLAMAPHPFLS